MIRTWPMLLATMLGLGALTIGMGQGGGDFAKACRLATAYTARVGFPMLMVTFAARPLFQLWPNTFTRALLRDRRWWGLGFAVCHTFHLLALITYFNAINQTPPLYTIIGGGAAYVLMFAMVLSSNNAVQRGMGRWWKRLHKTGIWYLWAIFALSYLARFGAGEELAVAIPYSLVLLATLTLRIATWRKGKA
ncbi:MAG: hypothetical protein AB7F98_01000 [Novosphingobium sp.]